MLLEGMYLPLTTPFALDGKLNLDRLEANVVRYSKTPAAGLVVLSRWAQPMLLIAAEQRALLERAAAAASPSKVLIAGIDQHSVAVALDTIEFAAACGYDVALLRPAAATEGDPDRRLREAVLYCTAIADRSPLPILLTSGPGGATALPEDTLVTLASHANIVGVILEADGLIPPEMQPEAAIKARIASLLARTAHIRREAIVTQVFAPVTRRMMAANAVATSSTAQFVTAASLAGGTAVLSSAPVHSGGQNSGQNSAQPSIRTRSKTIGFQIIAAATETLLPSLEAGAVGILPGFAASAPQACYEVIAAWKDGDPALAAEKQHRIRPMALRIEQQLGVAGLKYAAELTGYFGGRPRLPGLSLTAAEREEVEALMQGMKN